MSTKNKVLPKIKWEDDALETLVHVVMDAGIPNNVLFTEEEHFEKYKEEWKKIVKEYKGEFGRATLAEGWNLYLARVHIESENSLAKFNVSFFAAVLSNEQATIEVFPL